MAVAAGDSQVEGDRTDAEDQPRGYMRVNRGDEKVLTGCSMRWPECSGGGGRRGCFYWGGWGKGVWGLSRMRKCRLRKRGTWIRICITRSYMAHC